MFILSTIADVIQIEPTDFRKPSAQALEDNINQKYANRVIQKVGLCICFYDLLSASEGLIGHGDGKVNVKVEFRLIVFRPFKGEIIEGVIDEADEHSGLKLHIEFFDDILCPPYNLFPVSHFDQHQKTFIWINKDEQTGAVTFENYYDKAEPMRFRIEDEIWNDLAADEDEARELDMVALNLADVHDKGLARNKEKAGKKPAWSLIVSMCQAGCGATKWW